MNIYQIFYSEETKNSNDIEFLKLDNMLNQRPDWSEYWPIREFLLNKEIQEDKFYGFLSPKFFQKTGLHASDVFNHIKKNPGFDVYTYSPFFDHSALFINVFEQSNSVHPNSIKYFEAILKILDVKIDIRTICMHSLNTVYCNYFVAKPEFWRIWFFYCEIIFDIAENKNNELSDILNSTVPHTNGEAPFKVFVIERIASLLMYLGDWKVNPHPLSGRNFLVTDFRSRANELYVLDALKIAHDNYINKNNPRFLDQYLKMRRSFFEFS